MEISCRFLELRPDLRATGCGTYFLTLKDSFGSPPPAACSVPERRLTHAANRTCSLNRSLSLRPRRVTLFMKWFSIAAAGCGWPQIAVWLYCRMENGRAWQNLMDLRMIGCPTWRSIMPKTRSGLLMEKL